MNKTDQGFVAYFHEDILKIVRENKWIGDGTIDNPYICVSLAGFLNNFKLKGLDTYIVFKNCEFEGVGVIESKKMAFEDCRFKELGLQRSEDLSFKSCSVDNLFLWGVSNSSFERCEFKLIRNFSSYGNNFLNCNIDSTKRFNLTKETFDISPISKVFALIACTIGISLIVSVSSWLISGAIDFIVLIGQLIGTTLLAVFALYFNHAGKKAKKRPPNVISNN